ncbi:MAG TPA: hypothetical protein VGN97_22520 [Mesorhizobium sp.]|jgi:hypothetical protein|nr:hypothetical protein [Mesorhizobium sp.]
MDEALARLTAVSQTNDDLAASVLSACAELASIASEGEPKQRHTATHLRRKVLQRARRHKFTRALGSVSA